MAANNFKPFGIGSSANVTSQTDYEALAALLSGFTAGKASSAQINKALRQGTVMASVLAQFIANATTLDVLDNGDTATLLTNFLAALKANNANSFLQTANNFSEIKTVGAAAQLAARNNLGLEALLTGRLLAVKYITATGTYTPTAGTNSIFVQGVGTGGNGGGSTATSSTGCTACGGGGSGAYAEAWYTSGFSSVAVTIGAVGSANYGAGATGGMSSFGSLMVLTGGVGGPALASTSSVAYLESGGGAGGTATTSGQTSGVTSQGNLGFGGKVFSGSATSGIGASSVKGSGGGNGSSSSGGSAGGAASGRGAGGGGAAVPISSAATYGGNGSLGMFVVWEYA